MLSFILYHFLRIISIKINQTSTKNMPTPHISMKNQLHNIYDIHSQQNYLQIGADLHSIQELLGPTSIATTELVISPLFLIL
jgi:site-specific recombinase XerC